jgi:hypothetical protein
MHTQHSSVDSLRQALDRGFDRTQARRLAFVRWSMLEGYAQFSEYVTSEDPVIDTRDGLEPVDGSAAHPE